VGFLADNCLLHSLLPQFHAHEPDFPSEVHGTPKVEAKAARWLMQECDALLQSEIDPQQRRVLENMKPCLVDGVLLPDDCCQILAQWFRCIITVVHSTNDHLIAKRYGGEAFPYRAHVQELSLTCMCGTPSMIS